MLTLSLLFALLPTEAPIDDAYRSSVSPLPEAVREEMRGVSWRPACPVGLDDLRLVEVRYRDLAGALQEGELVVHERVAEEVAAIFGELFAAGFRIERMQRIEAYGGEDDKSMAANNTSAFNCRPVAGKRGVWSLHSYGVAVDINPKTNPFVRGARVDPPGGEAFLDRSQDAPGLIRRGDATWRAFTSRGWRWGGTWRSVKDYQHFDKPSAKPAGKRQIDDEKSSGESAPPAKASPTKKGASSPEGGSR